MKVNEYDLRDFNLSEKAIWLVTRWDTPELRLPSIYKNIFIPRSQVAIKYNNKRIFIPDWIIVNISSQLGQYKAYIPVPDKMYTVSKDNWEVFKAKYPFNEYDTKRYLNEDSFRY